MYDTKCFELAEAFLADEPKSDAQDAHLLAQEIQTAIEDWLHFDFVARHPEAET